MTRTDHIPSPALRDLYDGIISDPLGTLRRGPNLLHGDTRDLPVLLAMREAVHALLEDDGEGGPDEHDAGYFEKLGRDLGQIIDLLESQAGPCAVYAEWRRSTEAEMEEIASEFEDAFAREESAQRDLIHELGEAHRKCANRFVRALSRVGEPQTPTGALLENAVGYASQALAHFHARGETEAVFTILETVVSLAPRLGRDNRFQEDLVANALALCAEYGRVNLMEAIVESLLPREIRMPRLLKLVAA